MEELEVTGKTVEEALQDALDQLGLAREDIEMTVLEEGKSGILGMGAHQARILVKPKTEIITGKPGGDDIESRAKSVLQELLDIMGIEASIKTQSMVGEDDIVPIGFDISSDDSGILIGRRGQTISQLQYIVNLIVAHQVKSWVPVTIDIEGYRQRRRESLEAMAVRVAERVKTSRRPFTLEPMPAYDRRIIHLTLAKSQDVTTESTGDGENRQVVILPKNP